MIDPNAPEDALLRLMASARRWEALQRWAQGTTAGAAVALVFALARPHPATVALAAVALGVSAAFVFAWARRRRQGANVHARLVRQWEAAERRRDAAVALIALARASGRDALSRADIPDDDELLVAVDRRYAAELELEAAEDHLRAVTTRAQAFDELRAQSRQEAEALARADPRLPPLRMNIVESLADETPTRERRAAETRARAAEHRASLRKDLAAEFAGDAADAVARVDEALLAIESTLRDDVATEAQRRAFLDASRTLRALLLIAPKSIVYEGRAPATTIGNDPAKLRQVVSDAEEGARAGRVVESAPAAGVLRETARWSPYAGFASSITADVQALFDPVLTEMDPDDPLAPPPTGGDKLAR